MHAELLLPRPHPHTANSATDLLPSLSHLTANTTIVAYFVGSLPGGDSRPLVEITVSEDGLMEDANQSEWDWTNGPFHPIPSPADVYRAEALRLWVALRGVGGALRHLYLDIPLAQWDIIDVQPIMDWKFDLSGCSTVTQLRLNTGYEWYFVTEELHCNDELLNVSLVPI